MSSAVILAGKAQHLESRQETNQPSRKKGRQDALNFRHAPRRGDRTSILIPAFLLSKLFFLIRGGCSAPA
jgi:hypothetical protein